MKGVLAACALQLMVPFLRNHVSRCPGTFKIEPAETIELPSVLTYSFIPLTGAIIARQVKADERHKSSPSGASAKPSKRTSTGSTASEKPAKVPKTTPPAAPHPEGDVTGQTDDEGGDEEEDDDGEEQGTDDEAIEDQLNKVNGIQAKAKGPKGTKGKAKPKPKP